MSLTILVGDFQLPFTEIYTLQLMYGMYTCGFRINANLVKEGSFRINAKLVKEELKERNKSVLMSEKMEIINAAVISTILPIKNAYWNANCIATLDIRHIRSSMEKSENY